MTRVFKGSGSKAGKPKLVCTRAKTGAAEHGYRSVALPPLQDALLSKWQRLMFEVPAGDRGGKLDENRRDLVAVIDATEWQLEDLSARMQREPSQTLATRLRAVDAALRSYRSDLEVLEQQATLMDQGLATARLEALAEALEDESPNIGRINSALRSVFHAVTIDYGTGQLRFKWRQGGETAITYAWVD